MEPRKPSFFSVFVASLLTFAIVGLLELSGLPSPTPAVMALRAVGLSALAGALVGIPLCILVPAFSRVADPGAAWRRLIWPARETPGAALNRAAAWGLAGLAALLPLALVAFLGGKMAHGFNQRAFAGPFTALAALMGAFVGVVLAFTVRDLGARLLDRLFPKGRLGPITTATAPLLLVVLALAAVGFKLSGLELGAWRLGWFAQLALGSAVATALSLVLSGRGPLRSGPVGGVTALLLLGLAGWSLGTFADDAAATRALPLHGGLSRVVIGMARTLADADGDGFSAAFAGGDCDDDNHEVHPGAREVPGNGLDDNCEGGDAPLTDPAAPAADPDPPEAVPVAATDGGVPAPAPPRYAPQKFNVLFILVDTTRYDHLGLYGYKRDTSPNLDAWAKANAVVFDRVYAHAPNTPRSLPSIFTGRYPSRVGWVQRFASFASLAPGRNELFLEIFQAGGYRTEAVSTHWYFERAGGIKSGADLWDNDGFLTIKDSNTQSASPQITQKLVARLDALAGKEQPFAIFAHYFDPHSRYMQHKEIKGFGDGLMDKYDGEIAYTDLHLKPVFEALERNKLLENTVVVITSDHGEAFKEHGFHFHGRTLYEEETRVPLVVHVPGAEAGRRDALVGLVDLLPTLTHLVGLKSPQAMGQSLVPLLTGLGTWREDRTVYAESLPYPHWEQHTVALIEGHTKVLRSVTDNVWQVFDLKTDPGEQRNLLDADPEAHRDLRDKLVRFLDADPGE